MSPTYPDKFNPLAKGPSQENLRLAYEQSQVRSVIDSYHGRLDAFAEAAQNSVDAIENRWATWKPDGDDDHEGDPDAAPRLRIILNFDDNALEVIDNGVGINPTHLDDLLEPFVTDKRFSEDPTRGHKGVGTTFLAYGHPSFEIHTKIKGMDDAVGYRIEGGRAWAIDSSSPIKSPPDYVKVAKTHPSLRRFESGTFVRIGFDKNTSLKSLQRVLHNTAQMWLQALLSTTAIGNVAIGKLPRELPAWMQHLRISVEHPDDVKVSKFGFPLPHLTLESGDSKELQWLQNNPSQRREYSLIYVERTHESLKDLLKADLSILENDDTEDSQAVLDAFFSYEVSVYASLAYKNTFYDEQFKHQIGKPNAERLSIESGVNGGVLVASVGMPMASIQAHLSPTMQPQERRRYFLLVHFNDRYSPDIGRKTVPQAVEPLVRWLELALLRLLRTQSKRLLRDRDSGTRPKGATLATASEEIRKAEKKVDELYQLDDEMSFGNLVLQRSPAWETEVAAQFVSLLQIGDLPGYKLRAMPGGARYDALIDYSLQLGDQDHLPSDLRVSDHHLESSGLELTDRWLEFKQDVNAFISDLEEEDGSPSKKYFQHVNVLVTWSASHITSEKYGLESITRENWKDRVFAASTHFLQAENNEHRIEVIALQHVISLLYGDEQ